MSTGITHPTTQPTPDTLKNWIMVVLTLIFISLYGAALIGWLKPLADEKMVMRLEPDHSSSSLATTSAVCPVSKTSALSNRKSTARRNAPTPRNPPKNKPCKRMNPWKKRSRM